MTFLHPHETRAGRAEAEAVKPIDKDGAALYIVPPDQDRWNRLLASIENTKVQVLGHAAFAMVCPCCNEGVALCGIAVDPTTGAEAVEASCQTCGAGFEDIVNKTPREARPLPPMQGGFIPGPPLPPVIPEPVTNVVVHKPQTSLQKIMGRLR